MHQRVADPDRQLFAFFHSAMPDDPLIFVEVALTRAKPDAIAPIISANRVRIDPMDATTAVFYSISNCQKGLRGVSFGNFLIKQVVLELQRELPALANFVTLSPVPVLRKWAEQAVENDDPVLREEDRSAILSPAGPSPEHSAAIAARYLTQARRAKGSVFDPVAHFHLGNGAELHNVHANADLTRNGTNNSWGVMVNYLYDGEKIEANHQAYTNSRNISAANTVLGLAKLKVGV